MAPARALVTLRMAVTIAVMLLLSGCGGQSPTSTSGPAVASVAVSGTPPIVGATAQFSATATLASGTTQIVTTQAAWSSSNTSIATVNSSGIVTGVAAGEADITATYQNTAGRLHVTILRPAAPTYTLSGTVTDGISGGVLPNINVQATDSAGNVKSTLTGSSGAYSIGGLAAGSVTLTVSAISYQTAQLTVVISADTRLDIVLQRTVCTLTLSSPTLSFRSTGGTGAVTVTSQATGCAWTARSNDAFIIITSGSSGNDNGTVTFSVAANSGSARSGTLTIAGLTVTVTQEAAALGVVTALYDPTLKAPVCNDVGRGCDSGTLLKGSGSTEANQPNTIFSSCPDGAGNGHIATINSIQVSTLDGGALASGKAVRIDVSGGGSTANTLRIYITSDALHPAWTQVANSLFSAGVFSVQTVLPAGSVQAVRGNYAFGGSFGPGPCAAGLDDDNDDLVFRVQ